MAKIFFPKKMNVRGTFFNHVRSAFIVTYPPDSYDIIDHTLNGKKIPQHQAKSVARYYGDWLTLTSSLLGLPNRIPRGQRQSLWNILRHFVGAPYVVGLFKAIHRITGKGIVGGALGLLASTPVFGLALAWNALSFAFKLTINIATIATEFLPHLIIAVSRYFKRRTEKHHPVIAFLFKTVIAAASVVAFVGRAITSPMNNVRIAWEFGKKWGGAKHPVLGRILGGALALVSIAITTTAYSMAFAVAAAAILPALPAVAAVVAKIPIIGPMISSIHASVGSMPVLGSISATLGHVMTPVLAKLGLTVLSPAVVSAAGFGAFFGLAAATGGTVISKVVDFVSNRAYRRATKSAGMVGKKKFSSTTGRLYSNTHFKEYALSRQSNGNGLYYYRSDQAQPKQYRGTPAQDIFGSDFFKVKRAGRELNCYGYEREGRYTK